MPRPLPLMLCAALAVSAAALPVAARPTKVAMTQIDGDTIGLWMAMEDALDDKHLELVPTRHVTHVIERLGLDEDLADGDIQKLQAELGADAIVQGVFEPHSRKVRFTIFAKGKRGKPFNLAAGNAGTEQFRRQAHATMLAKLAAAMRAGGAATERAAAASDDAGARKGKKTAKPSEGDGAIETAAEDNGGKKTTKGTKGTKGTKAAKDTRVAKDTKARGPAKAAEPTRPDDAGDVVEIVDEDDDTPARPATSEPKAPEAVAEVDDAPKKAREPQEPRPTAAEAKPDEPGEPPAAAAPRATAKQVAVRDDDPAPRATARFEPGPRVTHSANRDGVRVDLGASMSTRDLRFQTTALANPPKGYKNTPVPGGRVEGELYPFALGNPDSWLAGIGVAGDFDQTIALTVRPPAAMTTPRKVIQRHYAYGLRYRLVFGHTPTSPTLTLGGGVGRRTFAVNRTGLMTTEAIDLPDVDYKLFDPGLAFRLPLGQHLALTLGGRALLVTAAGQIQRADQYGRAKILGGTASAGLEIIFGDHVAVRLAAEAAQLDYKFAGTGTLATSRDGDSTTIDVRGATDRYLGGAGTLAVFY